MSVTGELSRLKITGDISVKEPTRVCEMVADVMDPEVEGEDEMHPSKRLRVLERVPFHVPPEVEPQNRDFDVKSSVKSKSCCGVRFLETPR